MLFTRAFCSIMLVCILFSSTENILTFDALMKLKKSYSHVDAKGEPIDKKILKVLKKPFGIFVEAGAHNGIFQSNTKLLEKFFGWRGLLVEPSECLIRECKKNRPGSIVECCALVSNKDVPFVYGDFVGSLMSSVDGNRLKNSNVHKVRACTITELLKKHSLKEVDFFSLDVEGYELEVLKGLDFNYCKPKVFLIEIYKKDYQKILTLLESQGYKMISNFSNYNKQDNLHWDGSHNDYLFMLQ